MTFKCQSEALEDIKNQNPRDFSKYIIIGKFSLKKIYNILAFLQYGSFAEFYMSSRTSD